jgi:hypothetical protein
MPRPVTISQVIKVTKWSTYSGESNVSEHQPELFSGEPGTIGAGAAASAATTPATAAAEVESPKIAPEQEETPPKADASKADAPKADALKADAPNADEPKAEPPKVEAAKPATSHSSGTVVIMAPSDRAWNGDSASPKADATPTEPASGKRRFAAMAAVVALATVAGALGGALATAGLGHMTAVSPAAANNSTLEASVARIDADIAALKASVEHTSKVGTGQFNKTSDRLDKVEKAQAEPAAKLARLSEAVEKLRAASVAAPAAVAAAPVAAKDVTGSVAPPATAVAAAAPATPAPAAPPKPEVARLPTVEGWVLRDVGKGTALIESRRGMFEVYAGDPIPGLGRVDAIRKQDGRWVVVTSKGLIVAR